MLNSSNASNQFTKIAFCNADCVKQHHHLDCQNIVCQPCSILRYGDGDSSDSVQWLTIYPAWERGDVLFLQSNAAHRMAKFTGRQLPLNTFPGQPWHPAHWNPGQSHGGRPSPHIFCEVHTTSPLKKVCERQSLTSNLANCTNASS